MITEGGRKIRPSEIENALRFWTYIKEAIVVADRWRIVSALIGIELESARKWAQAQGVTHTRFRSLVDLRPVHDLIEREVEADNARMPQVQQVRSLHLPKQELDHDDGEVTAAMKVRRRRIGEKYADMIEGLCAWAARGAGRARARRRGMDSVRRGVEPADKLRSPMIAARAMSLSSASVIASARRLRPATLLQGRPDACLASRRRPSPDCAHACPRSICLRAPRHSLPGRRTGEIIDIAWHPEGRFERALTAAPGRCADVCGRLARADAVACAWTPLAH